MISLTNSIVLARGPSSYGYGYISLNFFGQTPNVLNLTGGSLTSEGFPALNAEGRTDVNLTGGAKVAGPFLIVASTQGAPIGGVARPPTVFNVNASGASELTGDSLAEITRRPTSPSAGSPS